MTTSYQGRRQKTTPRQRNPFVYGKPVPPTHFIGREEIIDQCYNRWAGPVRSSIAISGEQGVGKTSLLHYLTHLAREEQWGQSYTNNIFVYLYCPTLEQFSPTRFWRRVLELIKQQENDPELKRQVGNLLQQPEVDVAHFRRFLRWLGQKQFSLVLLLDGFTWIVKTDTADRTTISNFLSNLRAFTNLPDDYTLTMLTETREPLDILCRDIVADSPGSLFYNNFIFIYLPPFTFDEIDIWLERALGDAEFGFDQADRNLLYQLAGAHPALLQMAGYYLFETRRRDTLTGQTRTKIIENFERSARHYFSGFWNRSSPIERALLILLILAHLSKQFASQLDITNDEIQRLLQKYERDLTRLAERGLIQKSENTYQVFSVVFAWWIIREIAAENETTLAGYYKTINEESFHRAWQTLKKIAPRLTGVETVKLWIETHPAAPEQTDQVVQVPEEDTFPVDEERDLLRRILAQHKRNLYKLQERKAKFGLEVPLSIENQIEDEEQEIAQIETKLESLDENAAEYTS